MASCDQPGDGWTAVLRRQPVRIAEGRPEGGYTNVFEIICCDCGDHPYQDYSEVSPSFSGSAGHIRSRTAWPNTTGTSGCIASRHVPVRGR